MTVKLTRDDVRAAFKDAGLTYLDLNLFTLQRLQAKLVFELKQSGLMQGTYRSNRKIQYGIGPGGFWAALRCRSFYFKDREAVTFNEDKFIGFAGWADENNVQPILRAFNAWVAEIAAERAALVPA